MPSGFMPLDEVPYVATEWLFPPLIPLGGVTGIVGYAGTYKTMLVLDIAARVTVGQNMPLHHSAGIQGNVLYLTSEDTAATLQQRLLAAAGNASLMYVSDRRWALPRDLDALEEAVREIGAKLIVFDPLESYTESPPTNARATREVMDGLNAIARRNDLAIVVVRHFTKNSAVAAAYRGAGSISITAALRSELMLSPHPHDPSLRILSQLKSSLAAPGPSFVFRVSQGDSPRLEWIGQSSLTAAELLDEPSQRDRPAIEDAKRVLFSILGEGPVLAKEALDLGKQAGLSERTLRRAKESLNVQSVRDGFGRGASYYWELPAEDDPAVAGHWAEHNRERESTLVRPANAPAFSGEQTTKVASTRSIIRD